MKEFSFFIGEGKVRMVSPDEELSKSLYKDGLSRLIDAKELDKERFGKIVFENVYEALRSLMDSVMVKDGYKSYSHEASISYLQKYGVPESKLLLMDEFRKIRNGSKYYGREVSERTVNEILEFSEEFVRIIDEIST